MGGAARRRTDRADGAGDQSRQAAAGAVHLLGQVQKRLSEIRRDEALARAESLRPRRKAQLALRSMPVETIDGSAQVLRARPRRPAQVDVAVRLDRGRLPASSAATRGGGIADHPQAAKGRPASSQGGRDMAFHVDGRRPRQLPDRSFSLTDWIAVSAPKTGRWRAWGKACSRDLDQARHGPRNAAGRNDRAGHTVSPGRSQARASPPPRLISPRRRVWACRARRWRSQFFVHRHGQPAMRASPEILRSPPRHRRTSRMDPDRRRRRS